MGVKRRRDYASCRKLRRIAIVIRTAIVLLSTQAITRGADGLQSEATEANDTKSATAAVVEVLIDRGIKIPVRDGVHLVADVFRPANSNTRFTSATARWYRSKLL